MYKRFVNPALFDPWCLFFLIFLIWQLSLPAFAQGQPQVALAGKNILVLHAFEANMPINVKTDQGLMAALETGGLGVKQQFFEYLDLARNPGPEHRKHLAELMRLRYGQRKIDLIITLYAEPLQFVLNEGQTLFPKVPILALYLPPGVELPKTDRRIIQHSVQLDMIGTLQSALKLVPGAKRVYIVAGVYPGDKQYEDQARRDFQRWEGQLEFRYLSGLSLEDMLAEVSSAPPGTIVFFIALIADITGKTYTPRDVVQRLSLTSTAPVFGLYDTLLGYGIAGGWLASFEQTGTRAGQMALQVLGADRGPEQVAAVLDVPPVPMFDWRQLKRWNLSERALPKGSIVINKVFTLWDFRYYIAGALAFCLAETALIIFLIVQRRRKKVAEKSLRQKTEELDQFFNVTLDLLCIANTEGYFLRLNPVWEKILGYSRDELMSKRFMEFVHPDDVRGTEEALAILAAQKAVTYFMNRYRCKDGTYRWLEWSASPTRKLIYAAARDITERKQAEEASQESERMLKQNEKDLIRLTGRLITAQEEERSRLARELHDDLSQRLAVFAIEVGKLEQQLMDQPIPVQEKLVEMKKDIVKISQDVHSLSRQLHPSILDDLGLIKAVESECSNFSRREGVEIIFNHENIPTAIPQDISLALYRIIQEGLSNVSKHACAEHISVSLKGIDYDVLLSVQDDGIGFDLAEAKGKPGLGISSMRERVRLIDGELSIKSQPEKGTVISVRVPLTKEGE